MTPNTESTSPPETPGDGAAREDSAGLLLQAGLPAAYISNALRLPLEKVNALAAARVVTRTFIPEDRELADKVRGLVSYAVDEAYFEIRFGDPHTRAALIKTLVARGAGLVGQEGSSKDEFFTMWEDLMRDVRDPDKIIEATFLDVDADDA